jgi:hypothetical protein
MSKHLAQALSGGDADAECPVPSAHDKANEAHYFLHQMIDNYHECDRFRYSLSAFLQAARNVTFHLQSDLKHKDGFDAWYKPQQDKMKSNADLALMNSERVRVVHQEALVPASSMFFGAFENGTWKSGFDSLPLHPMKDSVQALIEARAQFEEGFGESHFLDPYRSCDCEEYGLTRSWSLTDLKGDELVEFCMRCLAAVVEVVSAAHEWCGSQFRHIVTCSHASADFRTLRESMICPEVRKAWRSGPTERVLPLGDTLPLRKFPFDDAPVLYTVTPEKTARGWVSDWTSPFWPKNYASMLVYSLGGKSLTLKNSVFFDRKLAKVRLSKR